MGYKDFLAAFAHAQKIDSVDSLLSDGAKRYSFQINSRQRARDAIAMLDAELGIDWPTQRVLDVGCAYGAFTIELALRGAKAVGIDINEKWLSLAQVNAQGDADVPFIHCDAASRRARNLMGSHGPFDIVFVNDVFEHIYDTAALLDNIRYLMKPDGLLYFKVPNPHATRHVLLEGHKGVFGISLLAPDYWSKFVKAPFHIYYRRWPYFLAHFRELGFTQLKILNRNTDGSIESTQAHIQRDVRKIKQHLKSANFASPDQFKTIRQACQLYFDEVEEDMAALSWEDLHRKYRVTFWEGIIHSPS
jgi:2-polyprenyl-3-methyl-5-hydroxy-6-metoxy-1,4-benzoquinol methylase